jgi:hypothetical protein
MENERSTWIKYREDSGESAGDQDTGCEKWEEIYIGVSTGHVEGMDLI